MKTQIKVRLFLSGLCLAVAFGVGGCATGGAIPDSAFIQTILNQVLPPDFEGDLEGNHDGFYFGTSVHLSVDLRGLKKVGDRWTWTAGGYKRDGFFSINPRASSCQTRSATSASTSPLFTMSRISSSVSGAIVKPKRAANRAARRMRTGSSLNAGLT